MTGRDERADEPWRVLVICTANVCRSPIAERVLQRRLDAAAIPAVVRSAGTHGGRLRPHLDTIRAAREVGVEISDHVSRQVTPDLVASDGADLVVTMTREHLRDVVGHTPAAWPRSFTLKEIVRRSLDVPIGTVGLDEWLRHAGEGRRAADLMSASDLDDLADPYGGPYRDHLRMAEEVDDLVTRLVQSLPER